MTTTPSPRDQHAEPRSHRIWLIGGMILAAALYRLLPSPEYRPPNFAPIGAMALFGGAAMADRRLGLLFPLLAMLISDAFIGFGTSQFWVYGAIGLIAILGRSLRSHRRQASWILAGSLGASLVFFVVTNFSVWLMSGMYTHTFGELIRCYTQAIPFFGNTVAGDLVFSSVLFGGLALLESREAAATYACSDN